MSLGQIAGVGGDLVGDHAGAHVVTIGQAEVFFRRDVAEHRTAVPADDGGANAAGDVVVAGGDVGRERPERVERSLVAPFELFLHVLRDHVHGHVAGAFVHDLHAARPGAFGEFALGFEFAELGFVVGVGDGAGAQAVTDGERHVVGGHDVADVVPVRVEEILFVMRETPLRHDRTTARNDAGHAARGERDVTQQHAGVDREIIHALLGLLDQRVAENLPRERLGASADFFQRLINRHGADGHGAVAENPLAGLVDVFAGGEIHQRVATPFDGPTHFLDLFVDGRSDGGVADVGVDFNEEVAADDHRLELGVVDVCRNDRATAGDFGADELGRDFLRDRSAKRFAGMLAPEGIARAFLGHFQQLAGALELHVFADGDELHLGRDDAGAGVLELRDDLAGLGAEDFVLAAVKELDRVAPSLGFGLRAVLLGQITVVNGFDFPACYFFDVAALAYPIATDGGQTLRRVAVERGIAPRARRVVNAHGLVWNLGAVGELRRRECDLAHRHADVGTAAGDVNAGGRRELTAVGRGVGGFGLGGGGGHDDGGKLRAAADNAIRSSEPEARGATNPVFPSTVLTASGSKTLGAERAPLSARRLGFA